jgi:hypothetical protein
MNNSSLSLKRQFRSRHDVRGSRSARTFPRTDYHFQPAADDVAAARATQAPASRADLRAFRQMSANLLAEGKRGSDLIEFGTFALVVGLIAWPLISLLIVLAQTARG